MKLPRYCGRCFLSPINPFYADVPFCGPGIFGPLPFRPVALNPAWLTPTVKQLAQGIYEEKAYDRMPIFADALEDAGCTNADILSHLRGGGEDCRGCWALDLILGKS